MPNADLINNLDEILDSANPLQLKTAETPTLVETVDSKSLFLLTPQLFTSDNNNDIANLINIERENEVDNLIESQIEQVLDFTQLITNMELNNMSSNETTKLNETTTSTCSLDSSAYLSNNTSKSTEELDRAAIKIQSTFRGYKTRKQMIQKKIKKRSNSENDNIANESNKKAHLINDPQVAAIKIQSTFRGYKTRKLLKNKKNPKTIVSDNDKEVNVTDSNVINNLDLATEANTASSQSEEDLINKNEANNGQS